MNIRSTFRLDNIPTLTGCYIYKDKNNNVLYVGKAKNIKKRLHQYFHQYNLLDPRIKLMLDQAVTVDFIITDSEINALILEANLIKKYMPRYNKMLKDDKRYVWLQIERKEDFPRIKLVREQNNTRDLYYGPYPSKDTIFRLIQDLRRIFPFRDCARKIQIIQGCIKSSNTKPCLYYHIGLCKAPCASLTSKLEYTKNIKQIKAILSGKSNKIIKNLKKEMEKYSRKREFERAANIRDTIRKFEYINQHILVDFGMDENEYSVTKNLFIHQGLKNLIKKINIDGLLYKPHFKIECYDISNIHGKNATGSMVVFIDGKPKKAFYRKFKIKLNNVPNDFAMIQEILGRRLNRVNSDDIIDSMKNEQTRDESFYILPDLIIIDGGKGQLSSAYEILKRKNLNLPIIGLAKKEEKIFIINLDKNNNIKFRQKIFSQKSQELFLIQRIRDEAHRFAITYHRNLRSKAQIVTTLDSISYVGEITKKKLLKKFKSWERIKKAKKQELANIIKNSRILTEILKAKGRF